jgi:hypothetical protein
MPEPLESTSSQNKGLNLEEQSDKFLIRDDYVSFADTFKNDNTQYLISRSINECILQALKSNPDIKDELKRIIKEDRQISLKNSIITGLIVFVILLISACAIFLSPFFQKYPIAGALLVAALGAIPSITMHVR